MYLWMIFAYLSGLLNCDLQRFMQRNPLFVHIMGLTAFFFLFTLIDTNNKSSIGLVWVKTFFVYSLFVLMTKSKWYFVIPVLVLLLIDQSMKKDVAIKEAAEKPYSKEQLELREKITRVVNIVIICLILVGVLHYMFIQYSEYKSKFSLFKLFFGINKCKMQK